MTDRRHVLALEEDPDQAIADLVGLVEQAGADDVEIGYRRPDGTEYPDDVEPGPDEAVAWYARSTHRYHVVGRRKAIEHITEGTHTLEPGEAPHRGPILALADLCRELGATVNIAELPS